jgi:two-component system KDP operon response regulator KdpE
MSRTGDGATLLVIDDEAQIRRFLGIGLRAQGYRVLEAGSGRDALAVLAGGGIDLALLDLGLHDLDGRDVLRELRSFSAVPVIVLSARAGEQEKVTLLDAGANDYVTKPFGMQELSARIRSLLRQRGPEAAPLIESGGLRIDLARRVLERDGEPVALTRKEWQLLAALLRHPGRVLTQPQLLAELWGPTHTADTHYLRILVARLRAKLGDSATEPRWIATEPGVGLRYVGPA